MKSKLKSKENNKYTAIEDENGKLLTSEEEIDNETIKHYTKVLENRQIKTNLKDYQLEREKLCEERINEARNLFKLHVLDTGFLKLLDQLVTKSRLPGSPLTLPLIKFGASSFSFEFRSPPNSVP